MPDAVGSHGTSITVPDVASSLRTMPSHTSVTRVIRRVQRHNRQLSSVMKVRAKAGWGLIESNGLSAQVLRVKWVLLIDALHFSKTAFGYQTVMKYIIQISVSAAGCLVFVDKSVSFVRFF